MSTLDPNRDHSITLEKAIEFTQRYRNSSSFNGKKGGFFGKAALQAMLEQSGAAGIRYYYGIDDEETPVLVILPETGTRGLVNKFTKFTKSYDKTNTPQIFSRVQGQSCLGISKKSKNIGPAEPTVRS